MRLHPLFFVSAALAALAAACGVPATPPAMPPSATVTPGPVATGFLEGHVSFIGVPCSPDTPDRRPPCDGPYPDYEVHVHDPQHNTHAPFATAITDSRGFYRVALPPGEYIIYTQNGILPENELANHAVVRTNETATLDLVVDTGIR